LPGGTIVGAHRHDGNQIVYASRGVLEVTTDAGTWIAPASRAIWVPVGTVHQHRAYGPTVLHTVGLAATANPLRLTGSSATVTLAKLPSRSWPGSDERLKAVTVPERSAHRVGLAHSNPVGWGSMVSKILPLWRAAPVAAVAFGVLTLGVDLAAVPLDSLTHQTGPGGPVGDGLSTAAVVVPAVAVGTLLAARRPRNPIGWILIAIILLGVSPTNQYAVLDYRMHHGTLPLGWAAVVLGDGWPLRRCSTPCADGCNGPATGGSTGPATTPRRSWPP
jgi:cupin domain